MLLGALNRLSGSSLHRTSSGAYPILIPSLSYTILMHARSFEQTNLLDGAIPSAKQPEVRSTGCGLRPR